jgi:ubiquinol-cytochrome c reductase subunit 8
MGWWGDMGGPTQKGIVEYSLSPWQQNAMRGAFRGYAFYGFKRIMQQVPYFALPFAFGTYSLPLPVAGLGTA